MNTSAAKTRSGRVQGIREDGPHIFRGIPCAQPAIGPLRFCPPKSVEPWSGVRGATSFSPYSLQPLIYGPSPPPEGISGDYLYVNVSTPEIETGRRPVLVWIHGGSFNHGRSAGPMCS